MFMAFGYRESIGRSLQLILGASKNPLLRSSSINVVITSIFAIYYSINLGPEKRSYLAAIFAISLILHTLFMHGPGLSFRSSRINSSESVQSFNILLAGFAISIPLFAIVTLLYSIHKQSLPFSLYVVAITYYLGSVGVLLITEFLLHHKRYRDLYFADIISALSLPLFFLIFYSLIKFSLVVCVLLSFFACFIFVVCINLDFLCRWVVKTKTQKHFLSNITEVLREKRNLLFFRITIFNSLLERGDKVIIAFLADPSLFAKFTFNIAPLLILRFLPQLFSRISVAKREGSKLTSSVFVTIFLIYLVFSVVLSFLIALIVQRVLGGVWFIGFAPLIAFAFYESLRVTYSLILAENISGSQTRAHGEISKFGMVIFPLLFAISLLLFPNSLSSMYLITSVALVLVFVWKLNLDKSES